MLSDGDSTSYDSLVDCQVYGDAISINKEECVNHVSKRMGTVLKKLMHESRAQCESICGKG